MSLVKCVYPDWEGGYTEGEHVFGNDDTCVVCGEPKPNVPSDAAEAASPRKERMSPERRHPMTDANDCPHCGQDLRLPPEALARLEAAEREIAAWKRMSAAEHANATLQAAVRVADKYHRPQIEQMLAATVPELDAAKAALDALAREETPHE